MVFSHPVDSWTIVYVSLVFIFYYLFFIVSTEYMTRLVFFIYQTILIYVLLGLIASKQSEDDQQRKNY